MVNVTAHSQWQGLEIRKQECRTHDGNVGIRTLARCPGGRLPVDELHRAVGRRREHRFHREARFELVRGAVHEIADHAHAWRIAELDQHDGIGRFGLEARRLAAVNDRPGEDLSLGADGNPFELARAAMRAPEAGRPMMARAIATALDLELALVGAAPELAVVDVLPVRQRLGRLRAEVVKDPATADAIRTKLQMDPIGSTSAEAAKLFAEETQLWVKVIRDADVSLDRSLLSSALSALMTFCNRPEESRTGRLP
jgi:hypothetical protein